MKGKLEGTWHKGRTSAVKSSQLSLTEAYTESVYSTISSLLHAVYSELSSVDRASKLLKLKNNLKLMTNKKTEKKYSIKTE